MKSFNSSKVTCGNKADFFLEGALYYDHYVNLIQKAEVSVHLQTYIFDMDAFGSRVHQALIAAAQRGVQVYVLIDSIGSKNFTLESEEKLKAAGVHFKRFNSLAYRWLYQWGRRLHHKILLVDHLQALVGGINVTTSGYGHQTTNQQLDFAVGLQGPVIYELTRYCRSVFRQAAQKKILMNQVQPLISSASSEEHCVDLKISINDWVYRRWQITKQYSDLTKMAQKEITIINSYFFPRRKFMRSLAAAARRGVKVRLILPRVSDWPSYILASQFLYSYFLKNGVEIYEWKKSILHGKLATVDEKFSTIGSFNLNYTGYQQNLEMNVDIYSQDFTRNLNLIIQEIIDVGCEKVEASTFSQKSTWRIKFLRFFFYIMLALIANFSVSLTYQEDSIQANPNKYFSLIRIIAAIFFLLLGIIGSILPIMPGIPFFVVSVLLVYRQIIFNKKINL